MPTLNQHELKEYIPLSTQEESKSTAVSHSPSRWKTKEFYGYYVVVAMVVPYMIYTTYDISTPDNANYYRYSNLLSPGWILGQQVDNSDTQYAQFRNNLPLLISLAASYLSLSHMYRFLVPNKQNYFYLIASIAVLIGLHGSSCIKIWIIMTTSYIIGKISGKYTLTTSWIFNLAILFCNEYYNGYKFASIGLAWLDSYSGMMPRWHVFFNFGMLRLISFNMDSYWKKPNQQGDNKPTDKQRIEQSCYESTYINFLTYMLYAPLYICGPIITFNNFMSQLKYRHTKLTPRFIVLYAARWISVVFVMELTLHYLYVVAISKSRAWEGDTPFQLSMIGYFNLLIIWMKLLIPWRFFRLWSMCDGILTEENMIRCMSNNFSAQRFWKSWHRSFNRWTIRYIYVPLGGSKYLGWSMWVVFTFVAIWHDIELKLLAWGWLICLFLLPEIVATRLFSFKKFGDKWYYRMVCGLGAVCNILMMMVANLVGFCLGLDGMKLMLLNIFSSADGLLFLVTVIACLYVAAQIMFEIRETEKRRGDPKYLM